jgi:glycosyltransferase involved in cell wall biosynthesis
MNVFLVGVRGNEAGTPDGISAAYRDLAAGLARLGHRVHLVLAGRRRRSHEAQGVVVHELPLPALPNIFSARLPCLDAPLTWSQAVHECLLHVERTALMDVVDVPLRRAAGFVTLAHHGGPIVVRLDAPPAGGEFLGDVTRVLWPESLRRATGVAAGSQALLDDASRLGLGPEKLARVLGLPKPLDGTSAIDALARDTVSFYSSVVGHYQSRPRPRARRVVQIMDALDYGDAVASIARRNARVLAEAGGEKTIYALYKHAKVEKECTTFDPNTLSESDGLLFHYWGFSELEGFLRSFKGPKAVDYHNITPTHYFSPGTRDHEMTSKGHEQLRRIAGWFDLILADSDYNLEDYARHLARPKPTLCLYPTVDAEAVRSRPVDEGLLARLRADEGVTFLFVGRIARNKRQDRVMEVFDHYWGRINRGSRLFLVGSYEHSPDFHQEVEALRRSLPSGESIVLTGKVADERLQAYYRAADVFLSASEHEGFGIPLLEAMAHDIPVIALARTAVPETMGRAGIQVEEWDVRHLAELVHLLTQDQPRRRSLLEGQRQNLTRFSMAEAQRVLAATVDFLREGKESPLMVWRGPERARG